MKRVRSDAGLPHALALPLLLLPLLLPGCGPSPSRLAELSVPGVARGPSATDPTITLHPRDHHLMLAWLADDGIGWRLWFARSDDAGASWSTPVVVSPPGERLAPEGDSSPRIACDAQGRVAIAWTTRPGPPALATHADGPPVADRRGARTLRFARSLDGGRTWSPAISLDADTTAPRRAQSHVDMATTDDGHLLVAWLDSRPGGDGALEDPAPPGHPVRAEEGGPRSVRVIRSADFGGAWSASSAQWSQECPCCRVATGMNPIGAEFLALRRLEAGDVRDVSLAQPGGWPVRAFEDRWSAAECPESGPALAIARDGSIRVAWFTGAPGRAGIWFRQGIPETYDSTVTPLLVLGREGMSPAHVSLGDAGRGGTLIACDADSARNGGLLLTRVEASGRRVAERLIVPGVRGASRPQVAASNTSRRAYVVWTERGDDRMRVRLERWEVGR